MREYSSVHTQQPAGPIREYKVDPYILVDDDLKYIFEDIRQVSITSWYSLSLNVAIFIHQVHANRTFYDTHSDNGSLAADIGNMRSSRFRYKCH